LFPVGAIEKGEKVKKLVMAPKFPLFSRDIAIERGFYSKIYFRTSRSQLT